MPEKLPMLTYRVVEETWGPDQDTRETDQGVKIVKRRNNMGSQRYELTLKLFETERLDCRIGVCFDGPKFEVANASFPV